MLAKGSWLANAGNLARRVRVYFSPCGIGWFASYSQPPSCGRWIVRATTAIFRAWDDGVGNALRAGHGAWPSQLTLRRGPNCSTSHGKARKGLEADA